MARKAKKRKPSDSAGSGAEAKPRRLSRRQTLANLAIYGLGGAALVGGAGAFALDFRRKLAEGDLDRIGQGKPAVVQIHDPGCSLCRSLQREARDAIAQCEDETALFLVANITSTTGAEFAGALGLPHVTLAFLNEQGRHVHTVRGVTPASEIKAQITRVFG